MKRAATIILSTLASCWQAVCQIPQQHPELCGVPNGIVALPRGFSAVADRESFEIRFTFPDGFTLKKFQLARGIDQICSLKNGRIVVFTETGGASGIYVLDVVTHSLVDSFAGYDPVMSPDQRWIASRKAYPAHFMELSVSEEYLLYDLSKSPSQNRAEGVALEDEGNVGIPVFPPGRKNTDGDHIGLPKEQLHGSGSSFFWSPDGKALAFVDGLMGQVSLVLVQIGALI